MSPLFGNRVDPEENVPLVATADEQIRPQIVQIFALVGEAMAGATHALLSGDRELAKRVVDKDIAIDNLVNSIVVTAEMQLLENDTLNIADRRRLLTLLRILPEVERSGDLAEHIARRAARGLGNEMSPRSRGLVERMGEVASKIWREATDVIIDGKLEQAGAIEDIDDELDDLHVSLTAELTSGSMTLPVAVELAPGWTRRRRLAKREQRFGDLHRVERGALAQVVVADEEREAIRHRLGATNSSDVARVLAGGQTRHRHLAHFNPARVLEQRRRLLR